MRRTEAVSGENILAVVRCLVHGDLSGDAGNLVAEIVTLPSQISEGLAEQSSGPGSTDHKRSERRMPSKKRVTLRLQQKSFQTHHWGRASCRKECPGQVWSKDEFLSCIVLDGTWKAKGALLPM